jgi:hypothetical protein
MSIGSNKNNRTNVLTLERTTYSQFLKQMLFLNFGQDVTMRMSFGLPCNLCPVKEVLMFTRKSVIWHLKDSLILHNRDGVTVTLTSCCSGGILKRRCTVLNWRSCSSFWACSMIASSVLFFQLIKITSDAFNFIRIITEFNRKILNIFDVNCPNLFTIEFTPKVRSCSWFDFYRNEFDNSAVASGWFFFHFFIGHDTD